MPSTNRDLFTQETPLAFYFLGAMMTDGCVSGNRVKLDSKDRDWLERICDAVFPNSRVRPSGQKRWCLKTPDGQSIFEKTDRAVVEAIRDETFPTFQIHEVQAELWTVARRDPELVRWLARYGCVENKSLILTFPTNMPAPCFADFVRGLIDGDGSIWIHHYHQQKGERVYDYQYAAVGLVSGSKDFVTGLKWELQSRFDPDSFTLSVVERESGGTALVPQVGKTYVLRIHNWSAFTFLRWLYDGPNLICLERKRAVAEQLFRIYRDKTDQDERRLLTAEAIRLRQQRFSHGKIMEFLNISRTQAKNYTRSEKGVVATSRTYARKTDEVVVTEMRRLKQEGLSPGLISERLGVPLPTVVDNVNDIDAPVTQTRAGDVRANQEPIERIVALLGQGKPLDEVARLTGASRDKVKYWKAKRLPGQPVTGGLRNTVTEEKVQEMHDLKCQGLTNDVISRRVGLSPATVKKHTRGVALR